jgi:hypothetical protein
MLLRRQLLSLILPDDLAAQRRELYRFQNWSPSRTHLEESAEIFGGLHAPEEALQLLSLILVDHVPAQRREFYRDFFLGHRIARIALGHVDANRM